MKYCKRCVYPKNHPLGIVFDDEGLCSGRRVHEEKDEIDCAEKEKELEKILEPYREKSGSYYDCIENSRMLKVSLQDGLEALRLVEAARRSHLEENRVALI
jgi:predicted dehydrogenase